MNGQIYRECAAVLLCGSWQRWSVICVRETDAEIEFVLNHVYTGCHIFYLSKCCLADLLSRVLEWLQHLISQSELSVPLMSLLSVWEIHITALQNNAELLNAPLKRAIFIFTVDSVYPPMKLVFSLPWHEGLILHNNIIIKITA